jgi:hypothetical protein
MEKEHSKLLTGACNMLGILWLGFATAREHLKRLNLLTKEILRTIYKMDKDI